MRGKQLDAPRTVFDINKARPALNIILQLSKFAFERPALCLGFALPEMAEQLGAQAHMQISCRYLPATAFV